jgi:hypothetical protein
MSEINEDIDGASAYTSGMPVQLEFVDAPALNGEDVEWTFRTVGGRTAPAGTVTAQIAVMSHDHNIIGGGTNTLHSDLGPHDIGGGRIHPMQYTPHDGSYYFSITIGEDVRYVSYRVHERQVSAA